MIQRIQTIYLFASAFLLMLCFTTSFAQFSNNIGNIFLTPLQIEDLNSVFFKSSPKIYSLGISIIMTALISFICIFMFKKRLLQLRLIRYTIILKLALFGIIGYFISSISSNFALNFKPNIGSLFIIIALVFDWLAYKAIKKDDDLVRSVDRIR